MITYIIYGSMAALIFFAIFGFLGIGGAGLWKLWLLSFDLQKATRTRISQKRDLIVNSLQTDTETFANTVFNNRLLREKLKHYAKRYHDTEDKNLSTCDIEELINYDLIDQIGGRSFCEHVGGALTSLGILGTFFGLVTGLSGFSGHNAQNEVDQITQGIQDLLGGMTIAFWTSIVGIIASVLFGVLYRTSFNNAYRRIDDFLRQFRSDIANTHSGSEKSLNQMQEMFKNIPDVLTEMKETMVSIRELSSVVNESFQSMDAKLGKFDANARITEINEITSRFAESMQFSLQNIMMQLTESIANYTRQVSIQSNAATELNNNFDKNVKISGSMIGKLEEIGKHYKEFFDTVESTNQSVQKGFDNIQQISQINMQVMEMEQQLLQSTVDIVKETQNTVSEINVSAGSLLQSLTGSIGSANEEMMRNISSANEGLVSSISSANEEMMRNISFANEGLVSSIGSANETIAVRQNEFSEYMQIYSENYLQGTTKYLEMALAIISKATEQDIETLKTEARKQLETQTSELNDLKTHTSAILESSGNETVKLNEIQGMLKQQIAAINKMDSRLQDVEIKVGAKNNTSFLRRFWRN